MSFLSAWLIDIGALATNGGSNQLRTTLLSSNFRDLEAINARHNHYLLDAVTHL